MSAKIVNIQFGHFLLIWGNWKVQVFLSSGWVLED